MTCCLIDSAVDINMNVKYADPQGIDPSNNGSLLYSLGFLNNQPVNLEATTAILVAESMPDLISASYYKIATDLVPTLHEPEMKHGDAVYASPSIPRHKLRIVSFLRSTHPNEFSGIYREFVFSAAEYFPSQHSSERIVSSV